MKNILRRGLSLVLALIMVTGLLPVTAFAAVDSTGKPDGVDDTLVLSIYTGAGFPGEPAVYGTGDYKNINSQFKVRSGATFASSAESQLNWTEIEKDIVQGATNGNTTVWGVYNTTGLDKYFKTGATILKSENEADIIRAVKNTTALNNASDQEVLNQYEIIWYVIKLQHSKSGWFGRTTTEWHIDGVIKEKQYYSVNYYGNGNTSGDAPLGTTTHPSDEDYVVLGLDDNNGKAPLKKVMNGVEVAFLGWSARADGSGAELAFYQPGDKISAEDLKEKYNGKLSLYAMWDTTTQYTATVNTYLDNVLTDEDEIHGSERNLYLSTDEEHYYPLTKKDEGVYTVQITGNGKFHLYQKDASGNYIQVGTRQLTIYNQNGSMDVNHYSVTYKTEANDENSFAKQVYYYGDSVTAITEQPAKDGYRFLGWKTKSDGTGNMIQAGGEVTASITEPIKLYAQWEKTVTVTVNVTINHKVANDPSGSLGYDKVKDRTKVDVALVSRIDDNAPYLETGDILKLSNADEDDPEKITETTYESYTFENMPGGTVDYTVVTSKSGYETVITPRKDEETGNWTIDVVMTYRPTNFDVSFTVETDPELLAIENTTGADYVPNAAIVKVTFWSNGANAWQIITQQNKDQQGKELPGVRVDLDENGRGTGSYPVWMYESDGTTPYGYRVEVTSFVYPDGTIVRASDVVTQDVAWTDKVYTATVSDVTDGRNYGLAGNELGGAYYDDASKLQKGTLKVTITMDLYNVTFDANGGKFGNDAKRVAEYQYKIPGFKDYVPTREGGYTFGGWYLDDACTKPATEGADLDEDITLYAKWIEPLTIQGDVTILGTYELNGKPVEVNDIDKAGEAIVVLQENRNGSYYEVNSQLVTFTYENKNGSASYKFTEIPNEGKEYRIQLLELNYTTEYKNEDNKDDCTAVFGNDNVAKVDAKLTFVPPSYDQMMIVDATAISEHFRPAEVLAKVLYRDTGDNHPYQVISQHRDSEDLGVTITLQAGKGEGSEAIWKWHTDGTLYDYQMDITKVDGANYDSNTAPFYISYGAPAYWNANTNKPSGELVATLIPNQYPVFFNLNAGGDIVTDMDGFKRTYQDENGDLVEVYGVPHTWSFDTAINAVPKREGYTFLGWTADVQNAYVDGKISADIHQEVTLTAQWEKITYTVETNTDPAGGGTTDGDGTYDYGTKVTVTATPNPGYKFLGWYENGQQVSNGLNHSFNIYHNHVFTAKFDLNKHTVTTAADSKEGGTTDGGGTYGYGTEVTVTATTNPGYTFLGWYENGMLVSNELEHSFTIERNRAFVAKFELNQYTVDTNAEPAEGGTTDGGGAYGYGTKVTVIATPNPGYEFQGWYENNQLVSEDEKFSFDIYDNHVFTARFVRVYEIITLVTTGGTAVGDGTYAEGAEATVTATPNNGYLFLGWYENGQRVSENKEYSFVVKSDRTMTAHFATCYTIETIAENGGTVSGGGVYESGATATITAEAAKGYHFAGWYDENGKLVTFEPEYTLLKVIEDRTFTAKFEVTIVYRYDYAYIFGYNDRQIGAEGPLLRGELAQMIYRLVKQNNTGIGNGGNSFEDTSGEWFQSGMSYMAKLGAVKKSASKAYPYAAVKRGEAYKMICLGLGFTSNADLGFSDYAAILRNLGYLKDDGKVTATILRWEFCELFNEILGRTDYCPNGFYDADKNEITAADYGFADLTSGQKWYRIMMLATSAFEDGEISLAKRMERNTYDFDR